jgi:mannan polymerase II complex ANP1 subunit
MWFEDKTRLADLTLDVWRPLPDWLGGEQPYDLNSWQESETALALADTLDEDAVIVEGYAEYATWRPHLAYLRDPFGDPDMEMEIDGVGGVSILAKAKVFRSGVHFPAFSFEKHAETEGFGKVPYLLVSCSYLAITNATRIDVQKNGVLGHWPTALYHMAFV